MNPALAHGPSSAMSWIDALYLLTTFIAVCLALALTIYASSRRDTAGGRPFLGMLVCAAAWCSTILVASLSSTPEQASVWLSRKIFCAAVAPVIIFMFAMDYTRQRQWFSMQRISALLLVPAITWYLLLTNPASVITFHTTPAGGFFVQAKSAYGPWFPVHAAYGFALIAFSIVFLGVRTSGWFERQRKQGFLILVSMLPAIGASVINTFHLLPVFVDLVPAGFCVTACLWGWALFRFKLVEIMPLALSTLIETMKDAVIVADARSAVAYSNHAASALFDCSPADLVGRPVVSVVPALSDMLDQHDEEREVAEVSLKQGTAARTFDVNVSPLSDTDDTVIGQLIVLRDVTERVRLVRDLDAYARAVAHDLKNPVAVISGYIELLELDERNMSEQGRRFLRATSGVCDKMTQIINELLVLASVRNDVKVATVPLDMQRIVWEVRQRLKNRIEESNADVLAPQEWPQAFGHAPWVEEVWVNYISNAIKYGGSPPRIELGAHQNGNGKIHFWVRDNGEGLHREQLSKLFEEFSRAEPTRAEGHGLGLSITKRIVERLGGEVTVTSTPGAGSTFGFTLPS